MRRHFLKTAALALLFSSRLLTAQPEQKAIPHAFPLMIEDIKCQITVYQISTPGGKINGQLYSQLKYVSDRWVVSLLGKDPERAFKISNPEIVAAEFAKQKESAGLQALPLEPLLK